MSRHGNFYIVAAPSGAGKTTLVKALAESMNDIKISISYTTREPRPGELDGVDYNFISEDEFQHMIQKKMFLEYATVYGKHYGTSHQWVLRKLERGVDVLLEIDWQGARQIRQQFTQAVSIFVLPPSAKVLQERLNYRQQDDPSVIKARMAVARNELIHYHEFDYLVVNDVFEVALGELKHIVMAHRLQSDMQEKVLAPLLEDLLAEA